MTWGQPSRGREIGSTKVCNTAIGTKRNHFVYEGRHWIGTVYNKATARTMYNFAIARYLPPSLGRLFVLYMVYVRPFSATMYCDLHGKESDTLSPYLFCSEGSSDMYWMGPELSKVMSQKFKLWMKVDKFGLQAWRQIARGITKKHIEHISPYFENDDKLCEFLQAQRIENMYASWQAGHSRQTDLLHYARNLAFPTNFQPETLEGYAAITGAWQEHWGVDYNSDEEDDPHLFETPKKKPRAKTIKETIRAEDSPETARLVKERVSKRKELEELDEKVRKKRRTKLRS